MARPNLQSGERVLEEVRLHWFFVLNSLGAFLAALFSLGLSAYLMRRTTFLVVTNRRLILSRGVFTRRVIEMELGRVAQVEVTAGLLDRLAGIGGLKVIALDQFHFELYPVAEPDRIKDLIMAATGEAKRGPAGPPIQVAVPASAATKEEILTALERLGKMRDGGLVSDAEFQAKKGDLLRRL